MLSKAKLFQENLFDTKNLNWQRLNKIKRQLCLSPKNIMRLLLTMSLCQKLLLHQMAIHDKKCQNFEAMLGGTNAKKYVFKIFIWVVCCKTTKEVSSKFFIFPVLWLNLPNLFIIVNSAGDNIFDLYWNFYFVKVRYAEKTTEKIIICFLFSFQVFATMNFRSTLKLSLSDSLNIFVSTQKINIQYGWSKIVRLIQKIKFGREDWKESTFFYRLVETPFLLQIMKLKLALLTKKYISLQNIFDATGKILHLIRSDRKQLISRYKSNTFCLLTFLGIFVCFGKWRFWWERNEIFKHFLKFERKDHSPILPALRLIVFRKIKDRVGSK